MECIPGNFSSFMRPKTAQEREESFDRIATRAWLKELVKHQYEGGQRVNVGALLDQADSALGTQWFNERYSDCPVHVVSAVMPPMTVLQMTKLGAGSKVAKAVGAGYHGAAAKPIVALFSSPGDGVALMGAHEWMAMTTHAFQLRVGLGEGRTLVLQPVSDIARFMAESVGWAIYP